MDIEFYKNLIPTKNYCKEKFMQYLQAVLEPGILLGSTMEGFILAFDLNNAAGVQLDQLAKLVGAERKFPVIPITGYDPYLSDETFRTVISAKIMQNYWDGTNGGFQEIWDSTIGKMFDASYVDNQDMSISVNITGTVEPYMTELILAGEIVPKPAGVALIVTITQRAETNIGEVPEQVASEVTGNSAEITILPPRNDQEASDTIKHGEVFPANSAQIQVGPKYQDSVSRVESASAAVLSSNILAVTFTAQ